MLFCTTINLGNVREPHMFECIRTEMRKGSPEGYNAENGYAQPARKHLSAIHRPFLAWERLHEGASLPDVPCHMFRGRPVHSNSIFVDGVMLFPQMDVWSR